MRVAVVMGAHWTTSVGGAELQAALVSNQLANAGHEVCFISLHLKTRPEAIQAARQGGVEIVDIQASGDDRAAYSGLAQAFRVLRPQVCYTRSFGDFRTVLPLCKEKGVASIAHVSSDNACSALPKYSEIRKLRLRNFRAHYACFSSLVTSASKIVCQTRSQYLKLCPHKPVLARRTVILPNLWPVDRRDPGEQRPLATGCRVVWIGSLKPVKRPEVFVQLARRLADAPCKFTMAGGAPSPAVLARVMRLARGLNNFEYVGSLSLPAMDDLLGVNSILVNTSRYEGFPNTFMQAWVAAVPVVSLSVDPDGVLERESIGLLSGSKSSLCADVIELVTNPERRAEMGALARHYVHRHHMGPRVTQSYVDLFESAVSC